MKSLVKIGVAYLLLNLVGCGGENDRTDAIAYYNRGLVWHEKRNFGKAIQNYNEAIRLDPTDAAACHVLGLLQLLLADAQAGKVWQETTQRGYDGETDRARLVI